MPRIKPVAKHLWPNGQLFQTKILRRLPKYADRSDVILLEIIPGKGRGSSAGFHLNVEDAVAIAHALLAACSEAIERRVSPWPVSGGE